MYGRESVLFPPNNSFFHLPACTFWNVMVMDITCFREANSECNSSCKTFDLCAKK